MQKVTIQKINNVINIARKAGYLIIGSDNLKCYKQKLYLLLKSDDGGKNLNKVADFNIQKSGCDVITFAKQDFEQIVGINNCKIVGLKNKGLTDKIIKLCKE